MKKVMDFICHKCIEKELTDCIGVASVPEIAKGLSYSENFVRTIVKKLKEKDLITSICVSGFDERKDRCVVVRGYTPTDKGKKTNSYENALYELTEQ